MTSKMTAKRVIVNDVELRARVCQRATTKNSTMTSETNSGAHCDVRVRIDIFVLFVNRAPSSGSFIASKDAAENLIFDATPALGFESF